MLEKLAFFEGVLTRCRLRLRPISCSTVEMILAYAFCAIRGQRTASDLLKD